MNDRPPSGFFEGVFDRTLTNLRSAWRDIALSARGVLARTPAPSCPATNRPAARADASCLDARGGEVTARARAADLGRTYLRSTPPAASASCGSSPASSMSTAA